MELNNTNIQIKTNNFIERFLWLNLPKDRLAKICKDATWIEQESEMKILKLQYKGNDFIKKRDELGEFYTRVRENIYIVVFNIDMSFDVINLNNF
jgi:hypothetical protein